MSPGILNPSVGGTPIVPPPPTPGTAQFPTALNGYVARPGSIVYGVDQYVGADLLTATKTLGIDGLPSGWDFRSDIQAIVPTGNDRSIADYNFQGYQVYSNGFHGLTMDNCQWSVTNASPMKWGGNGDVTITNVSVEGNNIGNEFNDGLFNFGPDGGTWTLRGIAMLNGYVDCIQVTTDAPFDMVISQALLGNNGNGLPAAGKHPDHFQFFGAGQIDHLTLEYVTHIMNKPTPPLYGSQITFLDDAYGPPLYGDIVLDHNTYILPVVSTVNECMSFALNQIQRSARVTNCYADLFGTTDGSTFSITRPGVGPYTPVTPTFSGCVNMRTGATLTG